MQGKVTKENVRFRKGKERKEGLKVVCTSGFTERTALMEKNRREKPRF